MKTSRCYFCATLNTNLLLGLPRKHHNSLRELKRCMEKGRCDICILIWTALCRAYRPHSIEKLLNIQEDPTILLEADMIDTQRLNIFAGESKMPKWDVKLSIFAKPDDYAAREICARNSTASSDPDFCIKWTKWRLSHCIKNHPQCGNSNAMPMPTRIIDLGDPKAKSKAKLFITGEVFSRYVALSYSWGEGVRHDVKLKKATLEDFQVEIPEASMTLAHRECLEIARKLGYRYVWIDAFCIIQDDKNDWAKESVNIAEIYGNAECTIVAGRSENSLKGFVRNNFDPVLPPVSIPYSNPNAMGEDAPKGSLVYLSLERSDRIGPVETRAWCFQEEMLSRRLMIYGEEQMIFRCRRLRQNEEGRWRIIGHDIHDAYDLSPDTQLSETLTRDAVLERWYSITGSYARRDLFDPTDHFATISGVALRFQNLLQCRFLAGLWEDDMLHGLLWRSIGLRRFKDMSKPIAVKGKDRGKPIERAPSWSWLALVGLIWPPRGRRPPHRIKDKSSSRCHPDSADNTWSPDAWDPTIVKYPFPQCRLVMWGCVRDVHWSKMDTSQPRFALKRSPDDLTVATGIFDILEGNPQNMSIMCVLGDEGLILQRLSDTTFRRLGYFVAVNDAWCYTGSRQRVVLV